MITIDLKAKPRVKRWLKDNKINFKTLQKTVNIFFNQIQKRSKSNKHYNIEIKPCSQYSSGYYFGFAELHVTRHLDQNGWSSDKKFDTFAGHFLHEFRHWIQDNMLNVSEHRLNYTDEDSEKENNKYYYNKWEVDARKFERQYKRDFIDLYYLLDTLSSKKLFY
jgi:hypothetical protein|tara:strand:- start:200 stop:691 length:492 start_codon:yes stop_codon:yes gene_type:complete